MFAYVFFIVCILCVFCDFTGVQSVSVLVCCDGELIL